MQSALAYARRSWRVFGSGGNDGVLLLETASDKLLLEGSTDAILIEGTG